MSDVNVPLLRKAVEWAEAEALKPEETRAWHQGGWISTPGGHALLLAMERCTSGWGLDTKTALEMHTELIPQCGSAYCIAGYVAVEVNGHKFEIDDRDWVDEDGRGVAVVAAEILGIDPPRDIHRPEAGHLFSSENKIEDIRRIAESLAGEKL